MVAVSHFVSIHTHRACARLLGSVARASGRAYLAVLKAAVPVGLELLKQDQDGSEEEAALEVRRRPIQSSG